MLATPMRNGPHHSLCEARLGERRAVRQESNVAAARRARDEAAGLEREVQQLRLQCAPRPPPQPRRRQRGSVRRSGGACPRTACLRRACRSPLSGRGCPSSWGIRGILLAAARRGARAPRRAGGLRASGARVTRRRAGAAPGWARGRQTRTPRPRTCARNWPRPRSARTPPAPAWPGAPSGRVQLCGCLRPAPAGRCRLPRTLLVVLCSLHTHGPHAAQCVRMPP